MSIVKQKSKTGVTLGWSATTIGKMLTSAGTAKGVYVWCPLDLNNPDLGAFVRTGTLELEGVLKVYPNSQPVLMAYDPNDASLWVKGVQ